MISNLFGMSFLSWKCWQEKHLQSFWKNLSIPISSSTSFRWAAQSATSQRFAEWSNLRLGKSTNLWLLWYFHPIKCTFWIKLNKQYQDICLNESWLDCCATCCEMNHFISLMKEEIWRKKFFQCYLFSLLWKLSVVIIIHTFLPPFVSDMESGWPS